MSSNFAKDTKEGFTFYQSRYSGIKIVFDNIKDDQINSNFTIGIPNDTDAAHGIEHLVFFGSKKYPYSLYSIADKYYGYIHGVTSTCITSYQLNTLNEEGYCSLLPILLEALFDPLFPESFYKTEVYHIDEDGYENGRIFNEERSKVLTKGFNYDYRYPNKTESNAIADFIPSLEGIKEYHKMYYRLDNCILTIKGEINHEKVLNVIEKFETDHHFEKSNEPIPDISYKFTSLFKENKFVDIPDIIDEGRFYCLWKYDKITVKEIHELSSLLKYFEVVLKPLFHEDEFCNRHERFLTSPYIFGFWFSRINPEKINQSYIDLMIQEIVKTIRKPSLDMKSLMKHIQLKDNGNPEDLFSQIRKYHIHGSRNDDNDAVFDLYLREEEYKKLLETDVTYWDELIKKFFTEEYTVLVFKPSGNVDEEQRKKELRETNERRSEMKEKISDVFRKNRKFFENESNLIDLDEIKVELKNKNPITEKITVEENQERLDIPIEYFTTAGFL